MADMNLGITSSASFYDDDDRQLAGRGAVQVWRKMGHDSTVAAIMYGFTMLTRSVEWSVVGDSKPGTDYLESQIADLSHPFADIVQQAISGLVYGFSFHETIYTTVGGRVGWEAIEPRPQHTLLKWGLDAKHRPEAFIQALPNGGSVQIPVGKGFLFRTDTTSPSGTSILRGAYQSWVFKRRAEQSLAVAVDRDLRGIPKIVLPAEVLAAGPGNSFYDAMHDIVTRIKRDEQMGLMFPSDRDASGNLLYDFEIMSGADPAFDQVVSVIRMHAQDIATTVLATFLGLGRDATGSRALAEPQQELFRIAMNALLDMVADSMNRQLVEPLFALNPTMTGGAHLTHTAVTDVDLEAVGGFLLNVARAGGDWLEDEDFMGKMTALAGLDADTAR